MPPKDTAAATIGLPYKEITETATQATKREHASRSSKELYFVDFKKLKVRDTFNLRQEYTEIPEFAAFIQFNGLPEPMVIDMLPNGTCYIDKGHRRKRAIDLIIEQIGFAAFKKLNLPGLKDGKVECFINDKTVTELDRLVGQFSSNKSVNYTPLEIAALCGRLATYFKLTQEQIGEKLGMSRQNVKNFLIIDEQSDQVKQAIKKGTMSPTAAVEMARKVKDADKKNEIAEKSIATGKKVKVGEVGRVPGAKVDKKDEISEDVSDVVPNANNSTDQPSSAPVTNQNIVPASSAPAASTTNNDGPKVKEEKQVQYDESREEIKQCQNVIKNLDRVSTIVSKIDNPQLRNDIERYLGFCQKDMAEIREWVHKNKKQNKIR